MGGISRIEQFLMDDIFLHRPFTGKSFDLKSYRAIPKKFLVLTLGLDTKGYFLGGENFF